MKATGQVQGILSALLPFPQQITQPCTPSQLPEQTL